MDKLHEEAAQRDRDIASGWKPYDVIEYINKNRPQFGYFAQLAGMVCIGEDEKDWEFSGSKENHDHFLSLVHADALNY